MGVKLVCTQDFHGVRKGSEITDPVLIDKYLAEKAAHFVKVSVDGIPVEMEPANEHADGQRPD